MDGALSFHAATVDADDFAIQAEGFFHIMADGEHREAARAKTGAEVGKQAVAKGAVEAVERLIEQEQLGVGPSEGTGEVDALALASR